MLMQYDMLSICLNNMVPSGKEIFPMQKNITKKKYINLFPLTPKNYNPAGRSVQKVTVCHYQVYLTDETFLEMLSYSSQNRCFQNNEHKVDQKSATLKVVGHDISF